jgi:hypothetical protein
VASSTFDHAQDTHNDFDFPTDPSNANALSAFASISTTLRCDRISGWQPYILQLGQKCFLNMLGRHKGVRQRKHI